MCLLHLHVARVQHVEDRLDGLRGVLHKAALKAALGQVDGGQRLPQPVGWDHIQRAVLEVVEDGAQSA